MQTYTNNCYERFLVSNALHGISIFSIVECLKHHGFLMSFYGYKTVRTS